MSATFNRNSSKYLILWPIKETEKRKWEKVKRKKIQELSELEMLEESWGKTFRKARKSKRQRGTEKVT